jgi:HD-like signal output (HDOD) protein
MQGEVRGDVEAERSASEQALIDEMLDTFASPDYHPPMLPEAALRLLTLSRDPNVALSKITGLLQSEPLIAAQVIRIAQSPVYSGGARILSIDDAVLRLGIKTISLVFAEAAMQAEVFSSETFRAPMQALRRHSTATAHIARKLAERLGHPGERLYLAGLLHDIGIAASLLVAPQLRSATGAAFTFEELQTPIHAVHEHAADVLGALWELPQGLRWVLAHHHEFALQTHVSPMAAIVCLSSWIASEAGANTIVTESAEDDAAIAAEHFGWGEKLDELVELGVRLVGELDSAPR